MNGQTDTEAYNTAAESNRQMLGSCLLQHLFLFQAADLCTFMTWALHIPAFWNRACGWPDTRAIKSTELRSGNVCCQSSLPIGWCIMMRALGIEYRFPFVPAACMSEGNLCTQEYHSRDPCCVIYPLQDRTASQAAASCKVSCSTTSW